MLTSREFSFSFYIVGFLLVVGALCGRFVCGWLCPFGLFQDLLHKIPFPKKLQKLPGEKGLRCLRNVILVGFVILLPMCITDAFGMGTPWFCAYLCPAGTLEAGIPLMLASGALREAAGWVFRWKRPNGPDCIRCGKCVSACPHGAIQAPFVKKRSAVSTGG